MTEKNYITQVSKEDMKELSALTNIECGFLIRIDRTGGKIKIGIDENALRLAMNGFVRNGGTNTDAASCTSVPFDPPS